MISSRHVSDQVEAGEPVLGVVECLGDVGVEPDAAVTAGAAPRSSSNVILSGILITY